MYTLPVYDYVKLKLFMWFKFYNHHYVYIIHDTGVY